MWNLDDSAWNAQTFAVRIYENTTCADGEEFNALLEKDSLGRTLSYQDETRGRIGNVTTASDVLVDETETDICINLSGKGNVIGRTMKLYTVLPDSDGEDVLTAITGANDYCCVIGYDEPPAGSAPYVPEPHHHHPSSHGSYDRYHHY